MSYLVTIFPEAVEDIQQIVDYYDTKQPGLSQRFEADLDKHLLILETNPGFRVRYDKVRCLPLAKFPYMIHFTLNKVRKTVGVRAVLHTSIDPGRWKGRT